MDQSGSQRGGGEQVATASDNRQYRAARKRCPEAEWRQAMEGRHLPLYFAWSRPDEVTASLGILEHRFPALFELRRSFWPRFEQYADAKICDQGVGGFLDNIQLANFTRCGAIGDGFHVQHGYVTATTLASEIVSAACFRASQPDADRATSDRLRSLA
jgi:hypothetical protein